jgi:glucose/arabinose dehydrogenase
MNAPARRARSRVALALAVPLAAYFALSGSSAPGHAAPGRAAPYPPSATGLALEAVVSGLESPVHLASPPGDPRLFIVEQRGRIRVVQNGLLLLDPFLDITSRVGYGGERGLLSVAFHPRYGANGFFFVNYTDRKGDTRVERYHVSGDRNRADAASAHLVLRVDQPYANHNGGHILFGPDSMLYIGMGDGGSGGDPHGNGQDRGTLLGKLLRIDVDHGDPYAIPAGNPFATERGMRPEIWAWGLRNPWRLCFDRAAGLIYIADVGQNEWEEIDIAPARSPGLNYGWNVMEGAHCFRPAKCDRRGLTLPVLEYDHGQGCSVTGGLVYRGRRIPWAAGLYFLSDYCSGWIWSFRYANGAVTEHKEWRLPKVKSVTSFGEDAEGEIYVLSQNGSVQRIAAAPGDAPGR